MSNSDLSLAKQTKKILNKNNIKLNKNLGQNYLIDKNKRDKIIEYANITNKDVVLEIGSGIGTLTIPLALKAKKVIAIEKDNAIYKILENELEKNNIKNVKLIKEDALNIDFPKFNKIVSNIPYQISSPLTFKFLNYDFDLAILMYQKEFANRMNGKVGTKNYSRLSAMLYFKCNVEKLTSVSAESFIPKPKVDSIVVKIKSKLSDQLTNIDEIKKEEFEIYSRYCKAIFQHKNKKIRNALIDSRHEISNLDKKQIKEKLNSITSDEINRLLDKRVLMITPEEILYLSKHLL